jgi:oligopeptide/dipeptide ABC transporter ATP-binding protein
VQAVDRLNFTLEEGKTLGIVGESGSGKTTVVRAILRIVDAPGVIESGEIRYRGSDLLGLNEAQMRDLRGRKIAMIFQDPSSTLDPLFTIGDQFIETILSHRRTGRREARAHTIEVLALVGVHDPGAAIDAYPVQFSAGMIQRMMIGMAICLDPDLILADEPTTGLGVLLQAQILNELVTIQRKFRTSMVLITHDMGVVAHAADHIMVMYAGHCVEYGPKDAVLLRPLHPYTLGLMQSVPNLDQDPTRALKVIPGFPPDLSRLPPGCPFADRCYRKPSIADTVRPALVEAEPGHFVACHSPVPESERAEVLRVSKLA